MGGASSEACGREFIMKKLPSYMRVTRGLALANQKNALAVNNFECRWNFGEGHGLQLAPLRSQSATTNGHFVIILREDIGSPDARLTGEHMSRPFRN